MSAWDRDPSDPWHKDPYFYGFVVTLVVGIYATITLMPGS